MGRKSPTNPIMGCIIIAKEQGLLGDVLTESEYKAVSSRYNRHGHAIATYRAVADETGIPLGSVQTVVDRAKQKFLQSNIKIASIPGAVRTVLEKTNIITPEKPGFHINQVPIKKPIVEKQTPMSSEGIDFGVDELLKEKPEKKIDDTVWTSDLGLASALVYHKFKMTEMRVNGIAKKATSGFISQPGILQFKEDYLADKISVQAKTFIAIRERIKSRVYTEADGVTLLKIINN